MNQFISRGDGIIAEAKIHLVFVNSDGTISSVASLLKRVEQEKNVLGRGEVSLCLIDPELPGEVELLVGDSYPINPQVYNALKALKGVLSVEEY